LRYSKVLLAAFVAAAITSVALSRRHSLARSDARRALMDAIGHASELDRTWSYDPASGRLVVGALSGAAGLYLLETQRGDSVSTLPTEGPWPTEPVVSPGGRLVLYSDLRSNVVRLLDLGSRTNRELFSPEEDAKVSLPSFSPDAQRIVYEHRKGGEEALRVRDLESGSDWKVFGHLGEEARSPVWTRDGRAVLFFSSTCIRKVGIDTGDVKEIVCVQGARSVRDHPDPPQLSPDGRTLAFDAVLKGCPHVLLADVEGHSWRFLDAEECGFHPVWMRGPEPATIAYIGYRGDTNRVPRIRRVDGAATTLGFPTGVASQLEGEPDGNVLAIGATPVEPRAVMRLFPRHAELTKTLFSLIGPELARRMSSIPSKAMVPSVGGTVPVLLFPPTCQGPSKAPVLIFLHGAASDIAERLLPEITYFTAMGYAVVAPNFRGSTGYGEEFAAEGRDGVGQVADVRAALAYARSLPELDGDRVVAVAWSGSMKVLATIVETDPGAFRAVSVLGAKPPSWILGPRDKPFPPVFWVYGSEDDPKDTYARVIEHARAGGHRFEVVRVDDDHGLAGHRYEALDGAARLFDAELPIVCDPRP
jgi:dipeptidyl aminopeptidase/acylaminoacyl peptidase